LVNLFFPYFGRKLSSFSSAVKQKLFAKSYIIKFENDCRESSLTVKRLIQPGVKKKLLNETVLCPTRIFNVKVEVLAIFALFYRKEKISF
jgi:hypothetical protein